MMQFLQRTEFVWILLVPLWCPIPPMCELHDIVGSEPQRAGSHLDAK